MTRALDIDRERLTGLRHVSGDDCEHCGCRDSIRQIEADLASGTYEDVGEGPDPDDEIVGWY